MNSNSSNIVLLKSYFVTGICEDHRSVVQLHVDHRNGEISFTGNAIACSFCNPSITSGLVMPKPEKKKSPKPAKPDEIPERYRRRSNFCAAKVRKPIAKKTPTPRLPKIVVEYEQRECSDCHKSRSFAKTIDAEETQCKLCKYFDSLHETATQHNAFADTCYRCSSSEESKEEALVEEHTQDSEEDGPLTQSIRRNYTGWLRWGRD